jgi:membrane protein
VRARSVAKGLAGYRSFALRAELAAIDLRRLTTARARRGIAAVAKEFADHDLLTYSSAISFQVLYAAIPLALLALAGMGLVGAQSVYTDHVAPTLHHALSHDAYAIANRTALHVMDRKRLWWGSLGLVVTLWGAGAALRSMMTPLNAVYDARETRSWLRRTATSIGAGALAIALVLAAVLVAMLSPLLERGGILDVPLAVGRWALTVVLLIAAIATLLFAVPAKRRPVEWISVGTALCTICWVVATLGFAAYISAVSYSSFYGAIAGLVLLLVYLHVSAIAFLLGVVVDSLLRDEVQSRRRS